MFLINLLFDSYDTFLSYGNSVVAYGAPPFPCKNPHREHQWENTIPKRYVKLQKDTSSDIGIFHCPHCHYEYQLSPESYQKSGFDDVTHIGFNVRRPRRHKNEQERSITTKQYIEKVSAYIREEPESTKIDVRTKLKQEYIWIQRHAPITLKELLSACSPTVKKKKGPSKRVDWSKRDEELLPIVQSCIEALKKSEPPVRITMYGISRYLLMPKLHLAVKNMPKSNQFIYEAIETPEEFKKRQSYSVKTPTRNNQAQ